MLAVRFGGGVGVPSVQTVAPDDGDVEEDVLCFPSRHCLDLGVGFLGEFSGDRSHFVFLSFSFLALV